MSNIVPDYSAVSFGTNPVGRNDVYGKRHVRETFRTIRTFRTFLTKGIIAYFVSLNNIAPDGGDKTLVPLQIESYFLIPKA